MIKIIPEAKHNQIWPLGHPAVSGRRPAGPVGQDDRILSLLGSYVYIYIYIYINVYISIYIYIYISLSIYIYIYTYFRLSFVLFLSGGMTVVHTS